MDLNEILNSTRAIAIIERNVATDEIIATTRSGWNESTAWREAAEIARDNDVIVRLTFNGREIEIFSDSLDED